MYSCLFYLSRFFKARMLLLSRTWKTYVGNKTWQIVVEACLRLFYNTCAFVLRLRVVMIVDAEILFVDQLIMQFQLLSTSRYLQEHKHTSVIVVTLDTFTASGFKALNAYTHRCTHTDLKTHAQAHTNLNWVLRNSGWSLRDQTDSCELKLILVCSNWFLRTQFVIFVWTHNITQNRSVLQNRCWVCSCLCTLSKCFCVYILLRNKSRTNMSNGTWQMFKTGERKSNASTSRLLEIMLSFEASDVVPVQRVHLNM